MSRGGDRGNRICKWKHPQGGRYCQYVPPPSLQVADISWRVGADIGNLDHSATDRDLEDCFKRFGTITDVWVARKPPGR